MLENTWTLSQVPFMEVLNFLLTLNLIFQYIFVELTITLKLGRSSYLC